MATVSGEPTNGERCDSSWRSTTWRSVRSFVPGQLLDRVGLGAEAALAGVADLGERRVQVVLAEVVPAERPAELGQRAVEALAAEDRVLLGPRLLVGVGDDREDARHDQHVLGVAALRGRPVAQLGAEGLRLLERRRRG